MIKKLVLVLNHPKWDAPVIHEQVLTSSSLSALIKSFKLSGKQACELKASGKTVWLDNKRVTHSLSLVDAPEATAHDPHPTDRKRSMFSEIKDKSCNLLLQQTPQGPPQLRLPVGK